MQPVNISWRYRAITDISRQRCNRSRSSKHTFVEDVLSNDWEIGTTFESGLFDSVLVIDLQGALGYKYTSTSLCWEVPAMDRCSVNIVDGGSYLSYSESQKVADHLR